ncbi:putative Zinc finger, C3HC [Helianthus annuus]|nr:putative Zinc finger, C3HC [Helianthus annuus]
MAEESEKRFHAVMDKLFLPSPPNSKPPSSSSRKRPYTMTTKLDLVDLKSKRSMAEELKIASGRAVDPPVCRPWDREDLLKRLATFKSMTWFAKPEVVSAVNCARRGWINVDTDTIACESCGARLFFSTPSSWAQEQVEKAASVFSLKLNSGHKLLCPWVDNACDEKLAQFPLRPLWTWLITTKTDVLLYCNFRNSL